MTAIPARTIREARAYLRGAGVSTHDISPSDFARAARELKKSFKETLRYLNLLLSGGQGEGPSRLSTADKDRLDPIEALGDNETQKALHRGSR